jgi:selenocysteine-specific elongation factor
MHRRFVIGTAGHVDHGKTRLVHALTGVDTDRLPEEKQRGISIELGFAPLDLGGGLTASVIDVPGHRRLVRAMIAGAAGMELVMLVVAADEGVMPQTREHVAVCELLGIDRAIVVVTKADAVDAELAAMAGEEATALLGPRWTARVVTCSARTGEGIEEVRAALRDALSTLPPRADRGHPRLGVDRVFTVRGVGTVVTGTLVSGSVAAGDAIFVVGERRSIASGARGLQVHDAAVDRAEAPTRLAINLAGTALQDVRRGDVVTSDPHLRATTLVEILVRGEHALRRGVAVVAHVGTAAVEGRVDSIVAVEGGVVARVRLAHATPMAGGDRVVLRAGSGGVVGGGVVLDARPDRRASGAKRRALAAALASLDAPSVVRALVDVASPRVLLRATLEGRFAVDARDLIAAADADGALARIGDRGWVAGERLAAAVARARDLVRDHLARAPLDRGLPLETLRERLGAAAERELVDEVLRRAAVEGPAASRLVVEGDVVRPAHGATASAAGASARVDALAGTLRDAGIAGATEFTLAQRAGVGAAEVRAMLQRLGRDGAAVRLGEIWFSGAVVADAREKLLRHFGAARTITVVEYKALGGFARKQAVLLLEHFDQVGLTRREGDARVLR